MSRRGTSSSYTNPIIPGFYPDPSICRAGEDFYLVNSSFEYFPGLPIFRSRNLVEWTPIGHAISRRSQVNLDGAARSAGLFAPTIRFHAGRFYLVCTDVRSAGNFVIQADDPAGEWSDPVLIPIEGIDPSLFFHEDRTWLTVSAPDQQGVWLAEIELATGRLLGEPDLIWRGTGGKYPEGPHLYLRDGWFYLLISEGGTEFGHMLTVARSRAIHGPYESCPHNPILSHRSSDHPLQATGHADWVQLESGDWWMVFLATRPVGYPPMHHMGRETCLAPFDWHQGWPVVNAGRCLPIEIPRPDLPADPAGSQPAVREDFERGPLAPCWNFRRNPIDGAWSLIRRPGYLSLCCTPTSLDDPAPMALLGRRQQHFDCRAETELDFEPESETDEAGLAVQMNEKYYSALVVSIRCGRRVVFVRRRMGGLRLDLAAQDLPPGPIGLRIVADASEWHLLARLQNGWNEIAAVETRHQSTELAGGFTGNYFAMFASGNESASPAWADFDWFDYEPLPAGDASCFLPVQSA